MKKCQTDKHRKRRKKELANRKAKQEQLTKVTPSQLPENKPMSPARKAFQGL